MKKQVLAEVWVIRHKDTREIWSTRTGKTAWKKSGAAKNAWAHVYCQGFDPEGPYFDKQTDYVLDQLNDMTDYKKLYEELVERVYDLDIGAATDVMIDELLGDTDD